MNEDKKIIITVRAVILHDGKLLAVAHTPDADYVALPGGKLEWGEDLKTCLVREMVEELGVEPTIGRLFYINSFTKENIQRLEFFFEVTNGVDYLDIENLTGTHAFEIAKIVWVSPADDINILPKSFAKDFKVGEVVADEVRYIKD